MAMATVTATTWGGFNQRGIFPVQHSVRRRTNKATAVSSSSRCGRVGAGEREISGGFDLFSFPINSLPARIPIRLHFCLCGARSRPLFPPVQSSTRPSEEDLALRSSALFHLFTPSIPPGISCVCTGWLASIMIEETNNKKPQKLSLDLAVQSRCCKLSFLHAVN